MIRIRGVTKSFDGGARRVEALRGVDLSIESSGVYAIMGPSGSGKSTLLHLIGGLDRPSKGDIDVAGKAVHRLSERELTAFRRLHLGIIFQQFNLIATMDAKTNVMLPGLLDGRSPGDMDARAEELLDRFGLLERKHHRPGALSGGEQQRVAIARALLFEPPVVLADEPTGNLDSASSMQIWRMLRQLGRDDDKTVIMVTHEPAAAVHADHVFVLRDGQISDQFAIEDHDARWLADRYQQSLG